MEGIIYAMNSNDFKFTAGFLLSLFGILYSSMTAGRFYAEPELRHLCHYPAIFCGLFYLTMLGVVSWQRENRLTTEPD